MTYKKLFLAAVTTLTLAACSDELVESPPVVKPAKQDTGPCKFIPFQSLPELYVDLRIAGKHRIRAFSQPEFGKQFSDRGFLRGIKIQQRAVNVPQNNIDHMTCLFSPCVSAEKARIIPGPSL